jgi:hypothetical protein
VSTSEEVQPDPVSPDGPNEGLNIPLSLSSLLERVAALETWKSAIEARLDQAGDVLDGEN